MYTCQPVRQIMDNAANHKRQTTNHKHRHKVYGILFGDVHQSEPFLTTIYPSSFLDLLKALNCVLVLWS